MNPIHILDCTSTFANQHTQTHTRTHLWNSHPPGEATSLHVNEPGILQGVAAQGEALSREHSMGPHLEARQTQVAVPQHPICSRSLWAKDECQDHKHVQSYIPGKP